MADPATLPASLREEIDRAGYYPDLVRDVVDVALAGEEVRASLVHQETTFDADAVHRHVTVLVLTPGRLVVAHADDHGQDETSPVPYATAATEAVSVDRLGTVVVNHVVGRPEEYVPGTPARELTLTIGWGAVSRLDLEPADCGDPECDADHGYTGTATADDISLRISAAADGESAVANALAFARALSAATARTASPAR